MSTEERNELRKWVQSGHSPYDNSWCIANETGNPTDFVTALHFVASDASVDVIYDPVADDIVFVASAGTPADSMTEELPF